MTSTQNTISRINAQFANLIALDGGEFITGNSVVVIGTIDADDTYTEVRRITLADLATDTGDFDTFRDEVVEALGDIAAEIAAGLGLNITGQDGDEQLFWTVSASK